MGSTMRTTYVRLCTVILTTIAAGMLSLAASAQWLPENDANTEHVLVDPNEAGWKPELTMGRERIRALSPEDERAALASLNCREYCGTPVSYVTGSGHVILQEFRGLRVSVLVPRPWFNFPSFTVDARHRFLDGFDAAHQYLNEITGRRPSMDLASVAYINPSACGSACGAVGGNWITVSWNESDPTSNWLWMQQTGLPQYAEIHEFTHNYDLLGGVDRYSGMGDSSHYWTTVMRWIYQYSYSPPDPDRLPDDYLNSNVQWFYIYTAQYPRTGVTFQRCAVENQSSCFAQGWNIPLGLLHRLSQKYGAETATRYTAFLRDKQVNDPPQNAQDRLDNHFEAYSAAAGRNLNCLWDQLGWRAEGSVSQEVINWTNTRFPAANPDCTNGPNGTSSILDFRGLFTPPATPNNYNDNGSGFNTSDTSPQHVTLPATINSHGMANRDQYFEIDGSANQRIKVYACSPTGFSGHIDGGPGFEATSFCRSSVFGPSPNNIRLRQTGSGTDTRAFTIAATVYVPPAVPVPDHPWAYTTATRNANGTFTISLSQIDADLVAPGANTIRFWAQNHGWISDVPLPAGWPNVTTMTTTWTPPPGAETEGMLFRAKASHPLVNGVPPRGYASTDSVPFYFHTTTKPALQLRQNVDPLPLIRGGAATYTLTVTNAGNVPTAGPIALSRSFDIPADATLVSIGGANWTCNTGATVSCTFNGVLGPGESAVLVERVTIAGTVGGTVARTASYGGGGDPDCTAAAPCRQPMSSATVDESVKLSVSSSANPSPFLSGRSGQYRFTVINRGAATTNAPIVLSDTLPSGITLISASGGGWSCTGTSSLTCTYRGTLGYQERTTLTLDVSIPASAATTSFTNNATLTGSGNFACENTTSCATQLTTPVTAVPTLGISLTTNPSTFTAGQAAAYVIRATNNGASATTAPVHVFFPVPGGVTFTSTTGSNWTCTPGQAWNCDFSGTLAPGQNTTLTFNLTVSANAPDRIFSNANVGNGGDPDCPDSRCRATLVTPVTGGQPRPALQITQSTRSTPLKGGTTEIYDLVVRNTGSVATSGEIVVTDWLPSGTTFAGASGTGWTCTLSGSTVTCRSTTPLAAQQSSTIVMNVALPTNAPAVLANTAEVSGGGDVVCPYGSPCRSVLNSSVTQAPMLKVTQVALPDRFIAGQPGNYAITVENQGAVATNGTITLSDTLPAGVTATQAGGTGWTCTTGATTSCTYAAPLGSGKQATVTMSVTVAGNATAGLINRAQVSGGGDAGCPAGARCKSTLNTPLSNDLIFYDKFEIQ
jgi:uncharacterized repeat protein (TIGR01451 family)